VVYWFHLRFSLLTANDKCLLSRCESCSGSHTSGTPYTIRAEPLTPTSPTRENGRSAMWSRISQTQSGELQADRTQQPQIAGVDLWPALTEDLSAALAISDLSDDLPTETRHYDRETYRPSAPFVPTRPAAIEPEAPESTCNSWDESIERAILSGSGGEPSIAEVDNEPRPEAEQERNAIIENGRYRVQSQRLAGAVNRGQAISATLALQRGVSIVVGPLRSCFLHPPEAHHHHRHPIPIPTSPSHIANPLPYTLRKGRGPSMLEFGKK